MELLQRGALNKMKKLKLLYILTAVAALSSGCHTAHRESVPVTYSPQRHPEIAWGYSYADALSIAESTGKPVMMEFFSRWCGSCTLMDDFTYLTPDVIKATWSVVPVRIDMEEKPDLAHRYLIRNVPSVVFLNSQGKVISKTVGAMPPEGILQRIQEALLEQAQLQY